MRRQRLTIADNIWLELEDVLDRHRRAGADEGPLREAIERAWHASVQRSDLVAAAQAQDN